MKNYDPKIAAQLLVRSKAAHGLSRRHDGALARTLVTSVLTEKAHVQALTLYAKWLHQHRSGKHLKNSASEDAAVYLNERAQTRKQSTMDLDRQAINLHLHSDNVIPFLSSVLPTIPVDRAYTTREIALLVESANAALALSISLADDAGLRSMELVSISRLDHLTPAQRDWSANRFTGREDAERFVVHGKGGLIREVRVSQHIAEQLISRSRPHPERISHRGAHLTSHFELVAGHKFCIVFGRLSQRVLGVSHGAHGLRHSFAQRRRVELLCCGFSHQESVEILSQELGHFSTTNTFAYLRD